MRHQKLSCITPGYSRYHARRNLRADPLMASRATLNAANLELLGASRLAELLLEISANDATGRQQLRLALADRAGPLEVARQVRKRLATIGKARLFVDRHKKKALIQDLGTQLDAIVYKVAPGTPATALELLWRFLGLAASGYERRDDSGGAAGNVFYTACQRLGRVAEMAGVAPGELAEQTYAALSANEYGQYDGLISILAPALGDSGLAHPKERMIDLANTPVVRPRTINTGLSLTG